MCRRTRRSDWRPGVDAVVRVPEIPDRTFPGKVTRIADALQPGTRTLLTEIDIPNPDGALTPGTYCTIELHIPRKTPSLLVPADAIIFNATACRSPWSRTASRTSGKYRWRAIWARRSKCATASSKAIRSSSTRPVDLVEGSKVHIRLSDTKV